MGPLALYALAIALCAYQAHGRQRAGLPVHACALGFLGALAATFEFRGHLLAALAAGAVYAAIFVKSQIIIAERGL